MTTVPYDDTDHIYIALKPKILKEYMCSWIVDFKDMYIGYCKTGFLSM